MTPAEALALVLRYARWSAASNKSGLGYHDTAAKMRKEIAEAERVLPFINVAMYFDPFHL